MASINNVVRLSLVPEAESAQRENMNICCIMSSDPGSVLSSSNRYKSYSEPDPVGVDFGTSSEVYQFALAFFAQDPNPAQVDGRLVIGWYRKAEETVEASAAVIVGAILDENATITALRNIADGSFKITVDGGVEQDITGLDFRVVTTLEEIKDLLEAEISDATVTLNAQNAIVITSSTTGATSTLTLPEASATGTFVGSTLGLSSGSGAVLTDGAASSVLALETKVAAVTAVRAASPIAAFMFIDSVSDVEVPLLAAYVQASALMSYDVFSLAANLVVSIANPAWNVTIAGQSNYRMLYKFDGDRKHAARYMARAHVVNFEAEGSALTMNNKTLNGSSPDSLTQTQIDSAMTVGLDVYVPIKNVSVNLCSGANEWQDNVYNILAFRDAIQTGLFNVLATVGTKVAQTQRGLAQLLNDAESTSGQFINAGAGAPGTWTRTETFGDAETLKNAIETQGFYWIGTINSDRQLRKATLQGAFKFSGAFHEIDVLLYVNY